MTAARAAGQRTAARRSGGQASLAGAVVTERDQALLAWLARHRFATAGQIERAFGMHRRAVYTRLKKLGELGLVEHQRWWHRGPGIYLVTRDGMHVGDVDLPKVRVDVRTYWHTLAAVDLAIELAPRSVVSEREIRAVDNAATETRELRYCPSVGRGAGGLRLHVPDLAVTSDESNRPHAYEVELTAKRTKRLRQILQGYVRARHLAGVTYVSPSTQIIRAVERVARELNATDMIGAQLWQPTEAPK